MEEAEKSIERPDAVKTDLSLGLAEDCLGDTAAPDEQPRHMEKLNKLTVGNLF